MTTTSAEHKEAVVISGVAGKFPECENVDELKDLLFGKVNAVTIDSRRWKPNQPGATDGTGKLRSIDKFDATFFNAHPKLAENMEPVMRLFVEGSVDAIIDAGLSPGDLNGTNTAVFSGASISDTEIYTLGNSCSSQYTMMGRCRTMQPNRVSYVLNLKGPSYNMDGGWICGSNGLEKAKNMIENGVISAAIVGVTNMIVRPEVQLQFRGLNRLNRNDRTKPFSSDADGYNRSEACVVVFLQRASEAKRSYGTLLSVKSSQFGDYGGQLMEHNGPQFKSLLLDSYKEADVDPATVEFVEAYGSGIKCEDSMELNVMEQVFCTENRKTPLKVGSVKGNVGHGEVCGLFVSLVKAIIALDGGYIPPNINYAGPNEDVAALKSGKIQIVTEPTPLVGDVVGVSSFGLRNAFSHVILKRNDRVKNIAQDAIPRLVLASGRTEENASEAIKKIMSRGNDAEYTALTNDVFTGNIKAHFYRSFSVFPRPDESKQTDDVRNVNHKRRPVWFVFSGMGSQWPEMGKELMRLPAFADAIDKCDRILAPRGMDIKHILTSPDPEVCYNILNAFVGIVAVQIGLVDVLKALGIEPDGIVGHSLGETGCAYADGCFTAEEMLLSAYARGRVSIETDLIPGMMAAVGLGYDQIVGRLPHDVDVACRNSAWSCTVSGPSDSVKAFVETLVSEGIFAQTVNVAGIAYHSRYIAPVGPALLKYLKEVIREPKPRSSKWISTSVPEAQWGSELARCSSAEYITNNMLGGVLFEDAIKRVPKDAIAIEIAPHGLLQAILRKALPGTVANIPLTKRACGDPVRFLLDAIGKMYVFGMDPKIQEIYPKITYPVGRGTPFIHDLPFWDHDKELTSYISSLIKVRESFGDRTSTILLNDNVHLTEHRVRGHHVLPLSYMIVDVWKMFAEINAKTFSREPVEFHDLRFKNNVTIHPTNAVKSYTMIQWGSGLFEHSVGDEVVFTGRISFSHENVNDSHSAAPPAKDPQDETSGDFHGSATSREIYATHEDLADNFKSVAHCDFYETNVRGRVRWSDDWTYFVDGLLKFPSLENVRDARVSEAPVSVRRMRIVPETFEKHAENNSVSVDYNKATKSITCDGVEISDVKYGPLLLPKQEVAIELQEQTFVRFDRSKPKDVEEFVDDAMDIITEAERLGVVGQTAGKLVVCAPYHYGSAVAKQCAKAIQRAIENRPTVKSVTLNWDAVNNASEHDDSGRFVTVTDSSYLSDTTRALANKRCGYAIVCSKQTLGDPRDWKTVMRRQRLGDGDHLTLIKKKISVSAKSVFVRRDDVEDRESSVREALDKSEGKVYVVSRTEPLGKVRETLAKFKSPRLRFVFILDSNAPEFESNESFYKDQLTIDSVVNVYKQGGWGFYKRKPLGYLSENARVADNSVFKNVALNHRNRFAVKCLGLNFDDTVVEDHTENAFGPFEYSGVVDNTNVMGIGLRGTSTSRIRDDPLLSWPVPSAWSLEDAATVPLSYALSYYVFNVLCPIQSVRSILVTSGLHPVGRAAISIGLAEKCDTFAIVDSNRQADVLSETFPELPRSRILVNENDDFDIPLKMITKSKGIGCVLSFSSGDAFHAALRSLADHGKFFQFSKADMRSQRRLGTRMFLRNTSFSAVGPNLLLGESDSNKEIVRRALADGLNGGTVRPFRGDNRVTLTTSSSPETNEIFDAVRRASTSSVPPKRVVLTLNDDDGPRKNVKSDSSTTYRCHHDRVYVIVVGDVLNWLELVEWLADREARQIVIAVGRHVLQASSTVRRRLDELVSRNVSVRIEQDVNSNGERESLDWLDRVASSANALGALFLIDQVDAEKVRNLRYAFDNRSNKTKATAFVCVSSAARHVCAGLESSGFDALNHVHWDGTSPSRPKSVARLLAPLDVLLRKTVAAESSSFVCSEPRADESQLSHRVDDDVIKRFFPGSADEWRLLDDRITAGEPGFVEVRTKSPRWSQLKSVLPAFVVPGFKPKLVDTMYERLLCPTFEARLPERFDSVDQVAETLVAKLEGIADDDGYVSLIGESWGGIVALKMAQLLEARGTMVTVTLVEADPEILSGLAESYLSNDDFADKLNASCCSFSDDETYDDDGQLLDARRKPMGKIAARVTDAVRCRLRALSQCKPLPNKLLTRVSILRYDDAGPSSGMTTGCLDDYCVNRPSVYAVADHHERRRVAVPEEAIDVIVKNLAYASPPGVQLPLSEKYENFFYSPSN